MCFNKEVSIGTYIIGMLGSLYLYKQGLIPEAIFYCCVVQMQLIEYFLWKHQSCKDIQINKNITKLAIIINHIEPLILWAAIIVFSKKILPIWVHQVMLGYIILSVIVTLYSLKNVSHTTVTEDSGGHLKWQWNNIKYTGIYYLYFLLVLIVLSIYGLQNGKMHAILVTVAFVISFVMYYDYKSTGAMWCFMAAFAPWIIPTLYRVKLL
jgi:hypothetical protein